MAKAADMRDIRVLARREGLKLLNAHLRWHRRSQLRRAEPANL